MLTMLVTCFNIINKSCSLINYADVFQKIREKQPLGKNNRLGGCLTSIGSISLAIEGERERDLRWALGSSSRDGVLEGVKLSIEST